MHIQHWPAASRGHIHEDWLEGWYSFSFAGWHDPERIHFGALRVLNDDIIAPANGFGWHPHSDMEIVTVVLEGTLSHRDNTGGEGQLGPGDVQVMTAGKGIMHMEFNNDPAQEVRSLQLWFFPRAISLEPRYAQAYLPVEEGEQRILVSGDGALGVLQVAQDMRMTRVKVRAGEAMTYEPLSPSHGQYFFVIAGEGEIADTRATARDAVSVEDPGGAILRVAADTLMDLLVLDVPML